jgi:HSP20 family protein
MTLIRRVNNYPVFQNWFEDIFAPVQNYHNERIRASVPAVNIAEDDNKFEIEFAVPGLSKLDFSVNLDNDILTVKSERENTIEETNSNYTRKEFNYSAFQRSFTLPEAADGEKIKAVYTDGILSIEIPKKEEAKVKPAREIEIA